MSTTRCLISAMLVSVAVGCFLLLMDIGCSSIKCPTSPETVERNVKQRPPPFLLPMPDAGVFWVDQDNLYMEESKDGHLGNGCHELDGLAWQIVNSDTTKALGIIMSLGPQNITDATSYWGWMPFNHHKQNQTVISIELNTTNFPCLQGLCIFVEPMIEVGEFSQYLLNRNIISPFFDIANAYFILLKK